MAVGLPVISTNCLSGPLEILNDNKPVIIISIDGKIGKEAMLLWKKYDHERPDYDTYIKRMKKRKVINKKEADKLELHAR